MTVSIPHRWMKNLRLYACLTVAAAALTSCTSSPKKNTGAATESSSSSKSTPITADAPTGTKPDSSGRTDDTPHTPPTDTKPKTDTTKSDPPSASTVVGEEKSWLEKTDQTFKNGASVYNLHYRNTKTNPNNPDVVLGEFWPETNGLDFVTKQSNPEVFQKLIAGQGKNFEEILSELNGGSAMAPDGMTSGSGSMHEIEGDTIIGGVHYPCIDVPDSNGATKPCEPYPNFGIVLLTYKDQNPNQQTITFKHRSEVVASYSGPTDKAKLGAFFQEHITNKSTVFFTPSIKRNEHAGKGTEKKVHRSLVRMKVRDEFKVGMVIFNDMQSYESTQTYLNVVNIPLNDGTMVAAETTHIFFTDGGPIWGQVARLTTDSSHPVARVETLGTADYTKLTNFIVLY